MNMKRIDILTHFLDGIKRNEENAIALTGYICYAIREYGRNVVDMAELFNAICIRERLYMVDGGPVYDTLLHMGGLLYEQMNDTLTGDELDYFLNETNPLLNAPEEE